MADAVSESARSVTPEGVALAIVVASPTFLGLSILAVTARAYVRFLEATISLDDFLLIGGLVSDERAVDEFFPPPSPPYQHPLLFPLQGLLTALNRPSLAPSLVPLPGSAQSRLTSSCSSS